MTAIALLLAYKVFPRAGVWAQLKGHTGECDVDCVGWSTTIACVKFGFLKPHPAANLSAKPVKRLPHRPRFEVIFMQFTRKLCFGTKFHIPSQLPKKTSLQDRASRPGCLRRAKKSGAGVERVCFQWARICEIPGSQY